MTILIESKGLNFSYDRSKPTLQNIDLKMSQGENFGIVGESGSGKSTLLRLFLGLLVPTTGSLEIEGAQIPFKDRDGMRKFRRSIQIVFQDPFSSLDPRQRIDQLIAEPLHSLNSGSDLIPEGSKKERNEWITHEVIEVLRSVGLPADSVGRYPNEFSGGQRQRIAIARAIITKPKILLADEPVSALDITTRVKIIDLLQNLSSERNVTIAMVSHDLSVIAALCPRIAVMRSGSVVEQGASKNVLGNPQTAYTQNLIKSLPRLG
jgi:ABC-type microcin C transport system duplicated ATPase subunit YejF